MENASAISDIQIPDDLLVCQQIIRELLATNQKQQRRIEQLEHQIGLLNKSLFGPRSEKQITGPTLFDGIVPPEDLLPPDATPSPPIPPNPKRNAKPHGRGKLNPDLKRERINHVLSDAEKLCPCCNKPRIKIGEETSEQLEYRPATLIVLEHHRDKYVCRECEDAKPESLAGHPHLETTHETAPMPPQPIDKGLPGPGLLAHIITSKYADHLPLNRLEGILARSGGEISRSSMCGWMATTAQLLLLLYGRIHQRILRSKRIHTDDTTIPVLDKKSEHTHTGYLWVYIGDHINPFTYFDFTSTHHGTGPEAILAGFEGYVQADAATLYEPLFTDKKILEVGCWAHARRKFIEAKTSEPARVHTALAFISRVYAIESDLKGKSDDERRTTRQALAKPILLEFHDWLKEQDKVVLPKGPFAIALNYTLSNYDALIRYTEEGYLSIDNNLAERTLRLIAVGRKNWMFAGSDKGAETAAVLYTFTASCKHLKIDPFAYLRDLLREFPKLLAETPQPTPEQLDYWLPDAWKTRQPQANPPPKPDPSPPHTGPEPTSSSPA